MRALVQRVTRARVVVLDADEFAGEIGPGLCVLVGATHDDTPQLADRMADKIWFLRVLADADGVMNRSLADVARDG
ncbi:MAG TPA: D-aminoacyl-tRNA deacylase, partial [Ilumatobacter sp.]